MITSASLARSAIVHSQSHEDAPQCARRLASSAPDPQGWFFRICSTCSGVESVVVETRSRQYVEERVRAGVLEQGTVDLMEETGVGERLKREGLVHTA